MYLGMCVNAILILKLVVSIYFRHNLDKDVFLFIPTNQGLTKIMSYLFFIDILMYSFKVLLFCEPFYMYTF